MTEVVKTGQPFSNFSSASLFTPGVINKNYYTGSNTAMKKYIIGQQPKKKKSKIPLILTLAALVAAFIALPKIGSKVSAPKTFDECKNILDKLKYGFTKTADKAQEGHNRISQKTSEGLEKISGLFKTQAEKIDAKDISDAGKAAKAAAG